MEEHNGKKLLEEEVREMGRRVVGWALLYGDRYFDSFKTFDASLRNGSPNNSSCFVLLDSDYWYSI